MLSLEKTEFGKDIGVTRGVGIEEFREKCRISREIVGTICQNRCGKRRTLHCSKVFF